MTTHPAPAATDPHRAAPWRDPAQAPHLRVEDLIGRMTLEEKTAQLYGVWVGADAGGDGVAPHQNEMCDPVDLKALSAHGLGQLTRPFGTAPVDPAVGALALARAQQQLADAGRFGIPALAHEECLAGFTTWGATAYPVPLAWGATFDPALISEMAHRIGRDLRAVGIHQGLAPVLDVARDLRWGRIEETIGEDPYLVSTIGTAYVHGLRSAGIVATLKHFVGYSASAGARNLSPVRAGARELADVLLPPFEMAVHEGGADSVMHSYAEIDGLPVAADPALLTELLRDTWNFTGTVVADYFGIGFLETLHRVAADRADSARLALTAGIDVELPTVRAYGETLVEAVRDGRIPERLVDRALRRVLLQKCRLGLLDPDWSPLPAALPADCGTDTSPEDVRGSIDLDPPVNRALARRIAEQSVVLLANPAGALPIAPGTRRIAVVGPRAHDPFAMLGCYSFPSHVGTSHPEVPLGLDIPTVLDALREQLPDAELDFAPGCEVDGTATDGFADAVRAAAGADLCLAVLGDRAGLFGRGTSGEGCDAADLRLPGVQGELIDALLATGTPVVLVLLTGRPYALGRWDGRCAAAVQAFFPGEEGGPASPPPSPAPSTRPADCPSASRASPAASPGRTCSRRSASPAASATSTRRRSTRSATACPTPPSSGRPGPTRCPNSPPTQARTSSSPSATAATARASRPSSSTCTTPSPAPPARTPGWSATPASRSRPARAAGSGSASTPTSPRTPARTAGGSSNPASCSSGWPRPAPTSDTPSRSNSPARNGNWTTGGG
ncbi:beta-glucosidase [Kitasatospora cheerisanensis KCTC 2395]|uniref:Beta-glucosidase n=1 Tax=Kitasatospora cheerisanensis KCTC 2395 TaxID=1348663 RepID=A0A066Z0C4_9ACTN|nr:beta-glucosidase [Kitasatospora cheerisanensis KCTC 2395]